MSELRDRLAKMRRLMELRGRLADVAKGESPGLAAVKAEGARIVAEREARLEREKAAPPEPVEEPPVVALPEAPKKKRRRRGRRGGRNPSPATESAAAESSSGTATSAAQRSLDPSDDLPRYVLRRSDGSSYTVSPDDPDVGPYARR